VKAATLLTVLGVALGAGFALTSGRAADQTPTPVITSKPLPTTNSSTATFAFNDTDLAATFECSLDGEAFSDCLSPKKYSSLPNGTHTFSVRAIDATNTEPVSESVSYTWTIDTVPPPLPTIAGPPDPTNSTSATFVFSDSEAGVTFGCRLDASGFPPCSSPKSFAGPLADGEHTFRAKAVDAAGNESPVSKYTWTVDTIAPAVPSIGAHAALVRMSSTTFTFSSAGASGFQCHVDGSAFAVCASGDSFGPFADGVHTFFVRAVDAAGNTSAAASFQWTIDTVAPPAPAIEGPPNPTNSTSATFVFSDSEAGVTFGCRLDASGFPPCSSPKSFAGPLTDGEHTFRVKAIDAAGNESDASSYTWTIDTVAPPVPSIGAHAALVSTASTTFTFSSAGASRFECHVDAAAFAACASGDSFGPFADGVHTFFVRAVDAAGNPSAAASVQWTIDTVAPAVPSIGGHASLVATASTTFTFVSAGASGFQCRVDGAAFAPCASGNSFGPFADGLHTFFVRAVDAAGNTSAAASFQWTIDTVVPTVTLTQNPPRITNQTSASFGFSSTAAGRFECALDAAFAPCSNTSPLVYTGLADGSHTFSVRAVAAITGTETKYTWTIDTVAPETTTNRIASSDGRSATFAFTSSEADSTFVCSFDGGGLAPCDSPKTYAGLGDGTHAFAVQAVDAAGNTDASPALYSWQIKPLTPAVIDRTPPGDVKRITRNVGYGVLRLAWSRPSNDDFDHVKILVSTSPKDPPRKLVYTGARARYVDRHFKNGLYYRYAVLSYDRAGNASRGATIVVPASVLLRLPRDGAVVNAPPLLMWDGVPKASYYNVQLYYGGRKVLSEWPNNTQLRTRRSWTYVARRYGLKSGLYQWYVWPGFGSRSQAHYGQLLGHGAFAVR
jgi:hypothetical protein